MSEDKNRGEFYYIEVKSKQEYKTFRAENLCEKDGIERVAGQRADGIWETVKWLIRKDMAHIENGSLVADHPNAKELFDKLDSEPKHIESNRFEAKTNTDWVNNVKPIEAQTDIVQHE